MTRPELAAVAVGTALAIPARTYVDDARVTAETTTGRLGHFAPVAQLQPAAAAR